MNKSIIFGLLASVALTACGSKEEVAAPVVEETPVEATAPVEASAEVLEEAKEAAVANQDEKSVADGEAKPE